MNKSLKNSVIEVLVENLTEDKINVFGKTAINSFAEGDEARMMLMGIKRFTKVNPFNTKKARRIVADYLIAENKYTL